MLYGRRHPAGWLAGVLLGYAAASVAAWAVVASSLVSLAAFAAAWGATLVVSFLVSRGRRAPLVQLPIWSRSSSTLLLLVLLLVPALVGPPFARLGSRDAAGNRQYRAYFIADFVWHMALTAELSKQEPRPQNPYLPGQRLHYYWTYFRVPATVAAQTGTDVEEVLKTNALLTALLLIAAIYVAAWAALPDWPTAVGVAVVLTTVAASMEGLAGIADVLRRGLPWSALRDLNIDAVAAWAFKGLRIDNLPRTMWYTPQHAFSCALGLIAIPAAIAGGVRAPIGAIALTGCALGASVAFNPLLGAAFCAVYGIAVMIDAVTRRVALGDLARHTLAFVPVAAALAWCTWNQFGDGAGTSLHVGFWGLARNGTVPVFLLQFGPLLVPMLLALWTAPSLRWTALWPALAGVAIAVIVMHFLALTLDLAWVGFRGGNIFFVSAPAIAARGLAGLWTDGRRTLAVAATIVVVLVGAPTTIIDAYNTQDVANRHLSGDAARVRGAHSAFDPEGEFHWTVILTPAQQAALDWIRTNTPVSAVVQAEPTVRGRETWSLIPSFAERRMATGAALPLPGPYYADRNRRVRAIYASSDARAAWQEAKDLGIDYLYVDATERAAYPAVAKFDEDASHFMSVFRNMEVAIYAVRP
jgi:hypothetical protein